MTWYVTTFGGYRIGPYGDYNAALQAAWIQFGMEGWVITTT